jgi:hypothetical protein
MPGPQPTIGLVLDCTDPAALARFWAAALDYVVVGEAGSYVALVPSVRGGRSCCSSAWPSPRL